MTGFDNIWQSVFTVFQFLTGEGWSVQMYIMWNHSNKTVVVIYFTLYIIVGVFFAFNLFIAVLSDAYVKVLQDRARKESAEAKHRA